VRRALLYAQVDDARLGKLHVFCTHLTAIQSGIKYEGSYADWDAENAAHVQALIDWAKEKAGDGGQVLVLGDLNTGPAGAGIQPSVPESYAKLPAAGYRDPFLSGPSAACTFCTDNPLVSPSDSAANSEIDHILTRNIVAPAQVTRVLDTQVEIDVTTTGMDAGVSMVGVDGGVAGTKRKVGLSDHYGLRLLL
jgi:endonuclease/exonuclease/phosphatase family metal-dependent hydrolase